MSTLKIHLTYQCTAQCSHCHLQAGTYSSPPIDYNMAITTIADLQKYNNLKWVVLLGGEPGLFPKLTHSLANFIHQLDLTVRIETNASWATDDLSTDAFLRPLCKAKAHIMLSVDAFHEPFVSLDCVERAIRKLDRLGGQYIIEVPYIDFPNAQHSLDIRTNELLSQLDARLKRTPCAPMSKGPVYFKGRAAHLLAPLVTDKRGVPDTVCDTVPWWLNGSQSTLDLLALDPEGYISKECGIAIDNVQQQSVKGIIESFDAEKHPILSTLIHKGPIGIAEEARALGYKLKNSYADKCHLCQEVREVIRDKYPTYLVPEQHYVERNKIPNKSMERM